MESVLAGIASSLWEGIISDGTEEEEEEEAEGTECKEGVEGERTEDVTTGSVPDRAADECESDGKGDEFEDVGAGAGAVLEGGASALDLWRCWRRKVRSCLTRLHTAIMLSDGTGTSRGRGRGRGEGAGEGADRGIEALSGVSVEEHSKPLDVWVDDSDELVG